MPEGLRGPELAAFELNSAHTLAVIRRIPPTAWDRLPGGSAATLRDQLLHLTLVRESICRALAGADTSGLGETFESPEWRHPEADLSAAFEAHILRCLELLATLDAGRLDAPFTTRFGNRSTPRNFLRAMLVEEVHHRAQMTGVMRLFGLEPPPFPGQGWVELGVPQGG
ncbi:MAG TPA: DinB family protein [Holophagaceae bacterium]|nr:DinB family protein [Holophagaceae bacterium]